MNNSLVYDKTVSDKCAVVVAHRLDDAYDALEAMNHRGQDAVGFARLDKSGSIKAVRRPGRVRETSKNALRALYGVAGHEEDGLYIGHVKYLTSGSKTDAESMLKTTHPFSIGGTTYTQKVEFEEAQITSHTITSGAEVALIHNGNLNQQALDIVRAGIDTTELGTDCDTEAMLHFLYMHGPEKMLVQVDSTYSAIYLRDKTAYVMRDRTGRRPLWLGRRHGRYVAASESTGISAMGGTLVEEIMPGTLVEICINGDMKRKSIAPPKRQRCPFEIWYLQDRESIYEGVHVGTGREELGALAWEKHKDGLKSAGFGPEAILTFLPDCPYHTAMGFSRASGLELRRIFYKIDDLRAFIQVSQADQVKAIKSVLFMDPDYMQAIDCRDVIIIDDTQIRATNGPCAMKILKDNGARKVAMILPSAIIGGVRSDSTYAGCNHGVAMPPGDRFAAARFGTDVKKIRAGVGYDYLGYLELDDVLDKFGWKRSETCSDCIVT